MTKIAIAATLSGRGNIGATARALVALCAVIGAACAHRQVASEADRSEADRPLFCQGEEQCNLYWRRAQLWIVNNSAWKIQRADGVVIETHNPTRSSTLRAYRATREPLTNGRERILIATACANMFGCEDENVAVAAFKRYVKGEQ